MKVDFSKMTKAELKAYIRTHHEDDEAIRELFDRSKGKRIVCSVPEDFDNIIANLENGNDFKQS